MGTSASSNGPVGGVPFDPPWLDEITIPIPEDISQPEDSAPTDDSRENQPIPLMTPPPQPKVAPSRRFSNARRALGEFVHTGQRDFFRKAVGHYSRTGMGGASNAARRMRTSTRSGASAFNFLQSVRDRTSPEVNEWVKSLIERNASPQEIADEIIRRITPAGGSQDETACRESMTEAIGDLLYNYPDVDLLHLGDGEIWTLIESFLCYEVSQRLYLDIGQIFENSSLSVRDRVTRLNEMRDYLKAEIHSQIMKLRQETPNLGADQLQKIMQNTLKNTFAVYEGEI